MSVDYKEKYYEMMEKNMALLEENVALKESEVKEDSEGVPCEETKEEPKEDVVEDVEVSSPTLGEDDWLYGSSDLEKRYGLPKYGLNPILLSKNIQFKWGTTFTINNHYVNNDYVRYAPIRDFKTNEEKFQMRWTAKGVKFLDSIFMK